MMRQGSTSLIRLPSRYLGTSPPICEAFFDVRVMPDFYIDRYTGIDEMSGLEYAHPPYIDAGF